MSSIEEQAEVHSLILRMIEEGAVFETDIPKLLSTLIPLVQNRS